MATLLGLVIFTGVVLLVAERVVSNRLLSADFYSGILAEHDVYNRFYDEVLTDDEVRRAVEENMPGEIGNADIVTYEDWAMILRSIAPPEYLRGQVERVITDVLHYLNGDAERLQVYLELGPVLDNVEPVLVEYIRGRIDNIPEEQPEDTGCSPGRVRGLAQRYAYAFGELGSGRLPASVPSIEVLNKICRTLIFDAVFGTSKVVDLLTGEALLSRFGLDPRIVEGLELRRNEIRREIVDGDTREALKASVPAVVSPVLADGIEQFRSGWLDERDRLEAMAVTGKIIGEGIADDLQADLDEFRQVVGRVKDLTWIGMISTLAGGSSVMVLIYLPRWNIGLRWLGIVLILSGGITFAAVKVMDSGLKTRLDLLIKQNAEGFPPSLEKLVSDLAASAIQRLFDEIIAVSVIVLIAGAVTLVLSLIPVVIRRWMSRKEERKPIALH